MNSILQRARQSRFLSGQSPPAFPFSAARFPSLDFSAATPPRGVGFFLLFFSSTVSSFTLTLHFSLECQPLSAPTRSQDLVVRTSEKTHPVRHPFPQKQTLPLAGADAVPGAPRARPFSRYVGWLTPPDAEPAVWWNWRVQAPHSAAGASSLFATLPAARISQINAFTPTPRTKAKG